MLFYLTTIGMANLLHVAHVMQEVDLNAMATEIAQAAQDDNKKRQLSYDDWVHSDFLCKNYFLNYLSGALYTAFCIVSTAREKLEKKCYNCLASKKINWVVVESHQIEWANVASYLMIGS